ncbi:hypothetical protein [Paenibacillus sp. SI8]|uniref:hypothetical protein n=1 Tax=unclassified Paenibacillus TaxID=185978 RepID=UPI00346720D9
MLHIVNYFYLESEDKMSEYGNMKEINYQKKNEYYFRCIVNFFKSSIYFNPSAKHYFICNKNEHLNFIRGFDFLKFCNDNNIEIIKQNTHYTKPTKKWAGSMYFFDALSHFENADSSNRFDNDLFLFFDNDVIINASLEEYFETHKDSDWFAYDISEEMKKKSSFHGVNLMKMDKKFTTIGGEAVGFRGRFIKPFLAEFNNIYGKVEEFYTEEHYLSQILSVNFNNTYKGSYINDTCKRVWTNMFGKGNIQENDKNFKILHFPSEKEYGLYWANKYFNNREYDPKATLRFVGILQKPTHIIMKFYLKKARNKWEQIRS